MTIRPTIVSLIVKSPYACESAEAIGKKQNLDQTLAYRPAHARRPLDRTLSERQDRSTRRKIVRVRRNILLPRHVKINVYLQSTTERNHRLSKIPLIINIHVEKNSP